ncbi:MAG: septum formation initiator family protein, partial [Myxococcota bacterium]
LTIIPYTVFKRNGREDYHRLQAEVAHMREGNVRFANENRRLSDKIEAYKTDPRLIERMARERLQLARPDEIVLIFEEPEEKATPAPHRIEP